MECESHDPVVHTLDWARVQTTPYDVLVIIDLRHFTEANSSSQRSLASLLVISNRDSGTIHLPEDTEARLLTVQELSDVSGAGIPALFRSVAGKLTAFDFRRKATWQGRNQSWDDREDESLLDNLVAEGKFGQGFV